MGINVTELVEVIAQENEYREIFGIHEDEEEEEQC